MEPTEGFYEFVAIVTAGSISAAARAMGTPRATLSRRLGALEERLGVRLVHRSTRRLVLSRAGNELFRRAERIVQDAREAEAAVQRIDDVPRGVLRVSAPNFGGDQTRLLESLFLKFLGKYPEVTLEVDASSRYVDLAAEGVDVAIRGGAVHDDSLIARRVVDSQTVPFASPAYLETYGVPQTTADLANHECVIGLEMGRVHNEWPLADGNTIRVNGRLATNNLLLRKQAALRGQGIAILPRQMMAAEEESGALIPVLEDDVGLRGALWLVYVDREYLEPKIRAFIDHAVEVLQSEIGL